MSRLEGAFEQFVERLGSKVEAKFAAIDANVDSKFRFLIALYVSSTLTIVVAVPATVLGTVLPLYSRLPPVH